MLIKQNGFQFGRLGPRRAIALGDSVTANDSFESATGLWTEGNGYFEQLLRDAAFNRNQSDFIFVRNAGVAGNTTPQMLARVDADVIAYHPDVCFLMAGTNDILPGAVDADYAAFFSTLEKTVVKLLLAGIDVALFTCPTKDAAPAEVAKAIPWYYMLAKHYGLPLVDAHRATANASTGQYKTGMSDDGTHPNQAGIASIIEAAKGALYDWLGALKPRANAYRAAVAATETGDMPNMLVNGNFVNQTTPPGIDGWDVNTTGATFSLAAATSEGSNIFHYAKTSQSSGGDQGAYALYGTGITSGFDDGDVLELNGIMSVLNLGVDPTTGSPDGFTFLMQFDTGDSFRPVNQHQQAIGTSGGILVPFGMEVVVPEGYSGLTLIPQWYVQDSGDYYLSDLTLWNKTKYEAVWKPGSLLNV